MIYPIREKVYNQQIAVFSRQPPCLGRLTEPVVAANQLSEIGIKIVKTDDPENGRQNGTKQGHSWLKTATGPPRPINRWGEDPKLAPKGLQCPALCQQLTHGLGRHAINAQK